MKKQFVKYSLVVAVIVAIVGIAYAAVQRETTIVRFQNGIDTSRIGPFIHGGATSDLTMVVGGATAESLTVTTDGAGDGEVVLPENSIGGDEVSGMPMSLVFCGQADESGTIYLSPTSGVNGVDFADGVDYSIAGTACDGLDGATEATQDLIVFPDNAFKVMGIYCVTNGTLGAAETVVFTMRSAAADLTPSITCTVSEAETGCASTTGTTTDVAAGATVAMKAVQTSNNADDDLWCQASIMVK